MNVQICREHSVYFLAVPPSRCLLKSFIGLSCLPRHQVGLLKIQTGAGMDEEADRQSQKNLVSVAALLSGKFLQKSGKFLQ